MKVIFILFTIILDAICGQAQNATIDSLYNSSTDSSIFKFYKCGDESKQHTYYSEVQFLDKDTIEIFNHTPYPSYGGNSIRILLSSNLGIVKIIYHQWDDVTPDDEYTFLVDSATIVLNFNPFEKGVNGLHGKYKFSVKVIDNKRRNNEGKKPDVGYFSYQGKFKC